MLAFLLVLLILLPYDASTLYSLSFFDSEVINGLVFKKTAAHKQMRANIKHPKLLILKGDIGQFSTGLSSMNSMKQVCMHALS